MYACLLMALIALGIQGIAPAALADAPQPRHLLARSITDERPALDSADRLWLAREQVLRLGASAPDYPPLDITISESDYEGLTADYAGLLGDMLGVRIEVLRYANRAEAIEALRAGRIDLLGSSNAFEIADADLVLSQPYADDQPVIVTPVGKTRDAADPLDGLDLAMVDHYLPPAEVQALYPNARLRLFPSIQSAIAAVAFGRADAYLGDAISSDYLISKNFVGSVQLSHFIKREQKAYAFALKRNNPILLRVIDSALHSIGDSDRLNILRRWSGGSTSMLQSRTALQFSQDEQRWIDSHPVVRVVINDSYAPLTFFDDDERFRGITADVLEQISLRTGLKFDVSTARSVQAMIDRVRSGKADMIGALGRSTARLQDLSFTRPYLANSYVLVSSNRSDSPDSIEQLQGKRLAVIRGTPFTQYLQQHDPLVQLVEAEDALEVMEMVVRDQADAAVNTQISANYFISRLFKDRLRIVSTLGNMPATSAFATAMGSTELLSILDKTLMSIPPRRNDAAGQPLANQCSDQRQPVAQLPHPDPANRRCCRRAVAGLRDLECLLAQADQRARRGRAGAGEPAQRTQAPARRTACGQRPGGRGQPGQDDVPGYHEPRDPHADECGHWHA
jgi:two-component system sensor histidine kinase EvgS